MSMDHRRRSRALVAAALAAALAAAMFPGVAAADSHVTVVASGLDNPRGLAVAPNGELYVAEAGRGGAGPCFAGPEGEMCFGATGAIARVDGGAVERVVTGLPSMAGADGSGAGGPHKVSFLGRGNLYVTIGLGGGPDLRAALGAAGALAGTVVRADVDDGSVRLVADLAAYEAMHNPDQGDPGSEVDSNPYGILATPQGIYSTDAGGNDLLFTDRRGRTETIAVFHATFVDAPPFLGLPPGTRIPMQAVPTGVAQGADGALYVSQLTGFPFPVGGSSIWRVQPGQAPTVFATGFTNVVDIAAGPDGSLYIVEIAKHGLLAGFGSGDFGGRLVRVAPNGTQTTLLEDPLFAPGGVAVDRDGTIYVTNVSIAAGGGQVLRITP
jgi:DNA-binding beta-propeller fold protein YncE